MTKLSDEMRGVVIRHMGARRSNGKLFGRYVKATVDAAMLRWADRVAELENELDASVDDYDESFMEGYDEGFEDGQHNTKIESKGNYLDGFEDGQADAIASFYGGPNRDNVTYTHTYTAKP